MVCNRCGASLPSEGIICKECGAMMAKAQIEEQKKWNELNKETNRKINLMSSKYNINKDSFTYDEPKKENKLLGLLVLVGVVLIIILFAAIKFFG